MTTMAAKGGYPENPPLAVATCGHTITRTAAQFLVKSDLVFGIGCSFARGGFSAGIPSGKRLVQVTVDSGDVDKDYPIDHAVIGDANVVLRQLVDESRPQLGKAPSCA